MTIPPFAKLRPINHSIVMNWISVHLMGQNVHNFCIYINPKTGDIYQDCTDPKAALRDFGDYIIALVATTKQLLAQKDCPLISMIGIVTHADLRNIVARQREKGHDVPKDVDHDNAMLTSYVCHHCPRQMRAVAARWLLSNNILAPKRLYRDKAPTMKTAC